MAPAHVPPRSTAEWATVERLLECAQLQPVVGLLQRRQHGVHVVRIGEGAFDEVAGDVVVLAALK